MRRLDDAKAASGSSRYQARPADVMVQVNGFMPHRRGSSGHHQPNLPELLRQLFTAPGIKPGGFFFTENTMNNPAMAGPGDAATWPPYTGHPNDPRRRPGFSGSITDRVRVGVANLQVIASIEYDDGDVIDTQVKTLERMDISGYLSIETLEDIARQIGTKHGV